MNDKIKNFSIGDFNFHVYSIRAKGGSVRGITIKDALAGREKIGFDKCLSITFTDAKIIDDENFRRENLKNIDGLVGMCEFILDELCGKKSNGMKVKKAVFEIVDELYEHDGFNTWWDALSDKEKTEIENKIQEIIVKKLKV